MSLNLFQPNPVGRHTVLSGIELSQNQAPVSPEDIVVPTTVTWQTFHLPTGFKRDEVIPELTGIQVCLQIEDADAFEMDLYFEVREFGDWVRLDEGSIAGAHAEGDYIWVTAYFNNPLSVTEEGLERQYQFGIQSSTAIAWLSKPGPLVNQSTIDGGNLMFRLLSNTADSGIDFLGNNYRSAVMANGLGAITTQSTESPNSFWLSKPNPSKFAVESLYFDITDGNKPTVFDRILLDPITPGVYFNLYYTDEGEAGVTEIDWEQKLWNPVYQTFYAERRQEHVLGDPVTAKFVKIEFTHLQPQYYQPGTFHQSIKYKKHPKWVLEYFMAKLNTLQNTDDINIARNIKVIFDGFALAYDYYVDDLDPTIQVPNKSEVTKFIANKNDVSDIIDQTTLDQIQTIMKTFTVSPAERVRSSDSMLAAFVAATKDSAYPIENILRSKADVSQVSSLDRMNLIIENQMPVMFFYLICRHTYRELTANFEDDRAYFVGVRELALTRDHYSVATDTDTYVESLSDFVNVVRNDFLPED